MTNDYSTEYSFVKESVPYNDQSKDKKVQLARILPQHKKNVKNEIEALLTDYLQYMDGSK